MIKVAVDYSDLEKKLKQFSKDLGKTSTETIKEMAKIGCTQLAIRSEPYGLGDKSKQILEKAIYKDISKTYFNVGQTYLAIKKLRPKLANAYSAAMQKGDIGKAGQIAAKVLEGFTQSVSMDGGERLKASRNARGRVGKVSPMGVTEKTSVDTLKAKKELSAGIAKAGFLQAGKSLGSKNRVAKWLNKNFTLGHSKVVEKPDWGTEVMIYNDVKYASNTITPNKIRLAVQNAYQNQVKKMQKAVDAIAAKV